MRAAMSDPTGFDTARASGRRTTEGHVYDVTSSADSDALLADREEAGDDRILGQPRAGIEKKLEYRTWTQAVTFPTRAEHLSPFFNQSVHCLGVEPLLGIEAPTRSRPR